MGSGILNCYPITATRSLWDRPHRGKDNGMGTITQSLFATFAHHNGLTSAMTMMTRILCFSLLLGLAGSVARAQNGLENQGNALLLNFGFGVQQPGGDLADRFGISNGVEVGADYILDPSNWFFGLEGQYFFGTDVKEDVLAPLRTTEGFIIANDRNPANVQLRERGYYLGARVGKLIGLSSTNPRAGLRVHLGAGLLQHKIRVQDDPIREVSQLTGDYLKGYDRLTNGLALHQFLGYQLLGKDGGINLIAGLEFFQGFTQNRRSFNYDTRQADTAQRVDLMMGIRFSWILPFYRTNAEDIYY